MSLQDYLTARQRAAMGVMEKQPKNKRLYSKLEYKAKKKFPSHPSPQSLKWLETEYERRGGTYDGEM